MYMKKADYIRDTLAIMGASSQVLRMEEIRIRKEMISDARRIANCDTANLDRSVDAAMQYAKSSLSGDWHGFRKSCRKWQNCG